MTDTVLIIDDEASIRRLLQIALKSDGYHVVTAADGRSGLEAAASEQPGLIILDLGLPDGDGHEVLAELRQWSSTPVIVLSARDHDREKVKALDNGAQDYVTKPFSVEELLARVRANLRDRGDRESAAVLDDGVLHIDLSHRLVQIDGHRVELTPKEYAVLAQLAKAPNRVVTQTQLLEDIWGAEHRADTHYLRIVVSHLRQKLNDDPTQPRYLRTEAGVGYRFVIETA